MAEGVDTVLDIPSPKKGNLKQCQNYRAISLISHRNEIMLRGILNRLKTKKLLAEERAGAQWSRSSIVKSPQRSSTTPARCVLQLHRLREGVWQTLACRPMAGPRKLQHKGRTGASHQALYENFSSAVLLNSQLGEFFKTTVGVRQGCLLSPILFNLVLEKIMQETLHDHHTSISICGRPTCNLRFADDIDLTGGSSSELQGLTNRHGDRTTAYYKMEISTLKTKIMTNSTNNISADISMKGRKLEEVTSFKYQNLYTS